ncbi:MAG TPA: 4Fe-4S dicluster domain-containing protein [Melioribacteraceae bacterium]|nr:4Fe-4S dicluster domain-containing protein [Melioribacteraceae bacterium]
MMNESRRKFLKTTALVGAGVTGLSTKSVKAGPKNILAEDRMGVLVDTTVCIGCRKCEWACKTAHDLPTAPLESYDDRSVFAKMRRPDDISLTIVNEYPPLGTEDFPVNVKVQCMHCDKPACVSACIVGAFTKEENGSVIWDTDKCIGCRYCMVACPFQIPAFEFEKAWHPEIRKCDFCFERTKVGKLPACVEICPMEVLTYGTRKSLIELADQRISLYPERYHKHIYGEYEVGGTAWLYLASRDFAELQFPKLGTNPAPGVSEAIQHGIFAYFVPPIALYALLGGVMWINKKKAESNKEKEGHHE